MSGTDPRAGRGPYANSWMDTSRPAFPMGGSLSLEESVNYLLSAAARPPPAPSPQLHHAPPPRASESIYYAPPPPAPVMAAGTHTVAPSALSAAVPLTVAAAEDKIRDLEASRSDLQARLAQSEETRGREDDHARLFQRRAQIQLQESVQALAARHEAQVDGQGALADARRRAEEAEAGSASLQRRAEAAEKETGRKEEELRLLRARLEDVDAALEAQKRGNERQSARIAKDAAIAAEREREVAAREEELLSARRAKVGAEDRAAALSHEYCKLEVEFDSLRAREEAARTSALDAEERAQRDRDENWGGQAERTTLAGEKIQLEESLRNILVINDQLLQRVYDDEAQPPAAARTVPRLRERVPAGGGKKRRPASAGTAPKKGFAVRHVPETDYTSPYSYAAGLDDKKTMRASRR
ncbi:hypothetical protein T484DRAFT_1907014 [Baffinella frigidus]|nr:hypothetical protein T484DRAFT_1907014 [Cryptophyta sp. CCMP2293]